jgi:hypothetical protein
VLLAPFAGLSLMILAGYWCGWMGRSAISALVVTVVASTVLNALALVRRRDAPLAIRPHLPVLAAGLLAFVLAVIPLARLGHPGPIGVNGDQVLYSNVTAYLERHGLPAPAPAALRPAAVQLSFIDWGLPLGFNYLHAFAGILLGLEAHESFSLVTALLVFLNVLALAVLARSVFGLGQTGVCLTALLAALSPAFLWVHYNDYGMHAMSLGLIPMAIGVTALALEDGSWQARLLAALIVSAAFTSYPYATAPIAFVPLLIYVGLRRLGAGQARAPGLGHLAAIVALAAVLNAPGILHVAKFLLAMFRSILVREFGDVVRHVPWSQIYGAGHHAVDAPPWPFQWVPGLSSVLGLAALAVTAYGAFRMSGRGRLLFLSVALAYVPFVVWLRFGLEYPYGTFKALTSATFAAIIGLAFGIERLLARPALVPRVLAGGLVAALLATNAALALALARSVTAIDLAPLAHLKRAAALGGSGKAIHVRDARDTDLLWLTYFLKDHDLFLAHASPYYMRKDWPFYRSAVDADLVLVRAGGTNGAPWAGPVVHEDERHRLVRRDPRVLVHLDFVDRARVLARGEGVRIGLHPDRIDVDGASFALGGSLAARPVSLRLGLFARERSAIGVDTGERHQLIHVAEDIAVVDRPIASLPIEVSLVNAGDRAVLLAGWLEVVEAASRPNVEPEALFDLVRNEVVAGSGLFAVEGWQEMESGGEGRWTTGTGHAVFRNPSRVVALHLRGRLPDQPGTVARVLLNDRVLGALDAPGPFEATFVVPAEALGAAAWGHLAIDVNRTFNPRAHGVSTDCRDLGVLITRAQFRSLDLPPGGLIRLGDGAARAYLARGWSTAETAADGSRRFVWADAAESRLWFALGKPSDLAVSLTAFPFAFPSAPPQRVRVFANGKAVADIAVSEPGWGTYAFDLPRSYLVPGANELRFAYRYLAAPSKVIPGSDDARTLAVAFESIALRPRR